MSGQFCAGLQSVAAGAGLQAPLCHSLSARTRLTCNTCRPATAGAALRAAAPRPVGVTAAVSSRTSSKGWELVPRLEGCSLSWGAAARAAAAAAAAARPPAAGLTRCRRAPHRNAAAATLPAGRLEQPKLASASRGGPTPGRAPSPQARQAIWCSHGVRYNAMMQSRRLARKKLSIELRRTAERCTCRNPTTLWFARPRDAAIVTNPFKPIKLHSNQSNTRV